MPVRDSDKDAPDGADTGFLSTFPEWHAFVHGLYYGLTSKALVTPPEPENKDVLKEPHYYRGGYIMGTFLQLVVLGAGTYFGVETGIGAPGVGGI